MCDLDAFVTAMHFSPAPPSADAASAAFAAACSDGTLRFFLRNGRVEKTVEAHAGAVTSVRWTKDGSCVLTAGEDGAVKSWSPGGRLRGVVAAGETAVYAAAWSPESHASGGETGRVVVARGKNLRVHFANKAVGAETELEKVPLVGKKKPTFLRGTEPDGGSGKTANTPAWRAHDGVVLAVDWCAVSNLLVSGGEDRKYKVWDPHGRLLFSCAERDHAITSVAWSPSGAHFAAGAYDCVWLCDAAGWCRETTSNESLGSTLSLAWSEDGRALAGACAKAPGVFVGVVLDDRRAFGSCVARLFSPRAVRVADADASSGASRECVIETRENVGAFAFEHGYLIVGVGTKALVYERGKWGAPKASVELGGRATSFAQSRVGFAAHCVGGVSLRVFSYDGQKSCDVPLRNTLKASVMNVLPSTLRSTHGTLSLAPECVCVVPRFCRSVAFFNLDVEKKTRGAETLPPFATLRHAMPVTSARLNQEGGFDTRMVAFLDENRDLFVARVASLPREKNASDDSRSKNTFPVKLAGGVDAFAWSESGDGLVAASRGGAVTAWHCASAVFVDPDLVRLTRSVTETTAPFCGESLVVERFDGNRATIRGGDGAVRVASVYGQNGTFFPTLHADCSMRRWDRAIRLCRFVRDDALWAVLAVRAVAVDELETAQIAYAALEAIEKVRFVEKARATPHVAARAAELFAFRREPDEAERVLLGAGLVFRAIELNLRLFDWDRALALALEHRTHIDTVLFFRAAYLRRSGRREDKSAFAAAAREVEVSEERVRMKMAQEREREKNFSLPAREETKVGAGAKEQTRVASSKAAKPGAAKAPAAARTAGTRTGSTRSR